MSETQEKLEKAFNEYRDALKELLDKLKEINDELKIVKDGMVTIRDFMMDMVWERDIKKEVDKIIEA